MLRVKKYTNNSRLKQLARDNMPFMGLEIHGLEEIKLDPNMPHTSSMKQKGIRIKVSFWRKNKMQREFDSIIFFYSQDHRGLARSPVRPSRPRHRLRHCNRKPEHKDCLGRHCVGPASCRRISTSVHRGTGAPEGIFRQWSKSVCST